MQNPKVSVLMSVYNGAKYLREAIESILSQTFTDFEFLIVNDCSNDNSPSILKEYANKDSRIRVITNEFNLGLTRNLNKMVREARGEYLARFDCDDISAPSRFEKQVQLLDAQLSVGMVSLWAYVIDGNGNYVRTIKYPTLDKDLRKALIQYNPFFHSGLMLRKAAIIDAGLYDETWRFAQDYELYFRIAKKWEIANVPEVLLKYRETENSITVDKNRKQVEFALKAKLKALREGQYSKWNYIHLLRLYISWLIPVGLKRAAKKLIVG
jgi:glycosyltransferase involved in cell wall biosynthesis